MLLFAQLQLLGDHPWLDGLIVGPREMGQNQWFQLAGGGRGLFRAFIGGGIVVRVGIRCFEFFFFQIFFQAFSFVHSVTVLAHSESAYSLLSGGG